MAGVLEEIMSRVSEFREGVTDLMTPPVDAFGQFGSEKIMPMFPPQMQQNLPVMGEIAKAFVPGMNAAFAQERFQRAIDDARKGEFGEAVENTGLGVLNAVTPYNPTSSAPRIVQRISEAEKLNKVRAIRRLDNKMVDPLNNPSTIEGVEFNPQAPQPDQEALDADTDIDKMMKLRELERQFEESQ